MRHTSSAAIAVVILIISFATPVSAGMPRCKGKRATIVGTRGPDRIRGTGGGDVIVARGGNDHVSGRGGNDLICGGRGSDYLEGNRGRDRLVGGLGQDDLNGGVGPDRLQGNRGHDLFWIGRDPGDDTIHGGLGRDELNASIPSADGEPEGGTEPAQIDLAQGLARTEFGGRDSLVVGSVENVTGSGLGDTIVGDSGPNQLATGYHTIGVIHGGGGDDVFFGGHATTRGAMFFGEAGDDLVLAQGGGESFDGGEGVDTFSICSPSNPFTFPLTLDMEAGTASLSGQESTVSTIEIAIGCRGDDVLKGDAAANLLIGNSGDDLVEGRAGDDLLRGGRGTDEGDGGEGSDICRSIETATSCES